MPSDDPLLLGLGDLLDQALANGDDGRLRAELVARWAPPDRRLVTAFAAAVGDVIRRPDPPVARLEALLDGWAALSEREAPGDRPEVVLPCAAVAVYGEAALARRDWFADEIGKLRRAAVDSRRRVRHEVAHALRRLLAADPTRTRAALLGWVQDDNHLICLTAVSVMHGDRDADPRAATGPACETAADPPRG